MKFGVREICDVVLKAKSIQKIGNKVFYKDEPVLYFDSLKTSSVEGAATTVYAQGGRGNSRLIAWEGERTVTFTMEDALISPAGFSILSGAGLIAAASGKPLYIHTTERVVTKLNADPTTTIDFYVSQEPAYTMNNSTKVYDRKSVYVMRVYNDEVVSEPYYPSAIEAGTGDNLGKYKITVAKDIDSEDTAYNVTADGTNPNFENDFKRADGQVVALIDYYVMKESGAQQIDITPDKFGGNYYLEASTLFRDTNGVDLPAEFIIPNCKIQSNFTFSMASSGDPSTFTFTMDAFPDYTRWDPTKKVLASIQILDVASGAGLETRSVTGSEWTLGSGDDDAKREKTWTGQQPRD